MRYRLFIFLTILGLMINVSCGSTTASDSIPTVDLKCGGSACVK